MNDKNDHGKVKGIHCSKNVESYADVHLGLLHR